MLQAIAKTSKSDTHKRMAKDVLNYFKQATSTKKQKQVEAGTEPSQRELERPSNIDLPNNAEFHLLKRTDSEKMDEAMKSKKKGNLRYIVN